MAQGWPKGANMCTKTEEGDWVYCPATDQWYNLDNTTPDLADPAIADYRSVTAEQDVFATNWSETDKS